MNVIRRHSLLHGTKHCPMRRLATILARVIIIVSAVILATYANQWHEESARERVARIAAESERMAMDKYLASLSDEDLRIIRVRWNGNQVHQ